MHLFTISFLGAKSAFQNSQDFAALLSVYVPLWLMPARHIIIKLHMLSDLIENRQEYNKLRHPTINWVGSRSLGLVLT
jgi:hypothetical protein